MSTAKNNQQVKTRQRVVEHGEVFTHEREVKAMLDLVKDQTYRIDSTFLEPACGSGNFLIEILNRKLEVLKQKYSKSRIKYETNLIKVASTLYGVELLEDNTLECRERLLDRIRNEYISLFDEKGNYEPLMKSLSYIINTNIICGDALNYTTKEGEPIVFTEWKFINEYRVKLRCFDYQAVLDTGKQISLFADDGSLASIPKHGKEYPPIHYLKLYEYENK